MCIQVLVSTTYTHKCIHNNAISYGVKKHFSFAIQNTPVPIVTVRANKIQF